jgi:hypothetical protein
MKKSGFLLIVFLTVTGFVTGCKKTNQDFMPGAGDPRIVGTWQLVERRFPKDSTYKTPYYSTRPDTVITNRDTLYTTRPDTSYVLLPDQKVSRRNNADRQPGRESVYQHEWRQRSVPAESILPSGYPRAQPALRSALLP